MEDKQFDKHIQQKLNDYSTESSGNWEQMCSSLKEQGFFEQDIEIDHIIQSKLVDFVDTEHRSDWDAFKTDLTHTEDSEFDSNLKANLDSAKASFKDSHWVILHESLLAEAYKRKRVAAIKVAELLLLLLFISGVFAVLPVKSTLYEVPAYRPVAEQLQRMVSKGMASVQSLWSADQSHLPKALTTTSSISLDGQKVENDTMWPYIPTKVGEASSSITRNDIPPILRNIPMATITPLKADEHVIEPRILVAIAPEFPVADVVQRVFTVGGGVSHNFIEVPNVGSVGIKPSQYTDTDYIVSATCGLRKGRIEAFTGLSFYRVSYSPNTTLGLVNNVDGQILPLSEIEAVNYAFFSIPLGVRVHAIEKKNWHLYGTAGINLDFKATTGYGLRALSTAELKEAENNPAAFGGDVFLREPFANDAQSGLLQGGRLGDNLSMTAFVGAGLSRRVTDRLSLYIQPTFHKNFSLDGSGAQNERIDNFRIEVGVSTLF